MANNKYFDADNPPKIVPTPSGNGKNPHYRLDPLKDEVVRDGEDDLQQMIEMAEKSCRIDEILKRYRQTGDPALLQQRQAMFGDYVVTEGSYQQLLVLSNQIRMVYDGLDPETKSKVGTLDQFMEAMAKEYKMPDEPKVEKKTDGSVEIGGVKYVPQTEVGSFSQTASQNPPGNS